MTENSLFQAKNHLNRPLSDLMRPDALDGMVGQSTSLPWLRRLFEQNTVVSLLIHGPPGVGKTTLARALFKRAGHQWRELSAVSSTLKDLKPVLIQARENYRFTGQPAGVFIDEIHRFNKAQQDALLPYLEEGSTILIGATTENPSFSINRALRSRMRLLKLELLTITDLITILERAWHSDLRTARWPDAEMSAETIPWIAKAAQGDARRALGLLEQALQDANQLDVAQLEQLQPTAILNYDKQGDAHYEYASALIKSMRGGDEQNAAYWLLRFVDGGGDPRFVFRRLAIFASEDVGNADPNALQIISSAATLFDRVGRPEGDYIMMQSVIYLSRCPKSREVVDALRQTRDVLKTDPDRAVPPHLKPKSFG